MNTISHAELLFLAVSINLFYMSGEITALEIEMYKIYIAERDCIHC